MRRSVLSDERYWIAPCFARRWLPHASGTLPRAARSRRIPPVAIAKEHRCNEASKPPQLTGLTNRLTGVCDTENAHFSRPIQGGNYRLSLPLTFALHFAASASPRLAGLEILPTYVLYLDLDELNTNHNSDASIVTGLLWRLSLPCIRTHLPRHICARAALQSLNLAQRFHADLLTPKLAISL